MVLGRLGAAIKLGGHFLAGVARGEEDGDLAFPRSQQADHRVRLGAGFSQAVAPGLAEMIVKPSVALGDEAEGEPCCEDGGAESAERDFPRVVLFLLLAGAVWGVATSCNVQRIAQRVVVCIESSEHGFFLAVGDDAKARLGCGLRDDGANEFAADAPAIKATLPLRIFVVPGFDDVARDAGGRIFFKFEFVDGNGAPEIEQEYRARRAGSSDNLGHFGGMFR